MMHTLAIVCTLAVGADPGRTAHPEVLPPEAASSRAAAGWETSVPTEVLPAAPAPAQPVRALAVGLYQLWKPVSPLGRAYRPGEFPYRSWYKHPYLVYRGNYFRGRYDYHRMFDYPWHAPVSVPAGFLPAADRARPGWLPEGALLTPSIPFNGTLEPAPQGQGLAPDHPDIAIPE